MLQEFSMENTSCTLLINLYFNVYLEGATSAGHGLIDSRTSLWLSNLLQIASQELQQGGGGRGMCSPSIDFGILHLPAK